jgi:hypothetical protein
MLNNAVFHPPKLEIGKCDNVAKSIAEFLSLSGPAVRASDSNSERVIQSQKLYLILSFYSQPKSASVRH